MHINELITTLSKTSLIQKTNIVYFLSLIDSVSYGKGEGRRKRGYRDINMVKIQNRLKKFVTLKAPIIYVKLFSSIFQFLRISQKSNCIYIISTSFSPLQRLLYSQSLLNPLFMKLLLLHMCMCPCVCINIAFCIHLMLLFPCVCG